LTETAKLRDLVLKYIAGVERVFAEIHIKASKPEVVEVLDCAKRYLDDAKFFAEKEDYRTALVSIVYSEGLLDALKMLKFAAFSWHFRSKTQP